MQYNPFNKWSLCLLMLAGAIIWVALTYASNAPDPEIISTHSEWAEVVHVGKEPDRNQIKIGRYGTGGLVSGSTSSGRVRLDNGTEFYVLFVTGRPEPGSRIEVKVQTYEDGKQRVSIKRGF